MRSSITTKMFDLRLFGQEDGDNKNEDRYVRMPLRGPLDQFSYPLPSTPGLIPGTLTAAQNVVYRRIGAVGKRTGSGPYGGTGAVGSGAPVISGTRYYTGRPSVSKAMIVQSHDTLWKGNDGTGAFTSIGALAGGSSPAFFTTSYDPVVTSDILIIAYGSGQVQKYTTAGGLSNLSSTITQNFTGTCFWHEHVWYWGDPNNPTTLYASDLGSPETMAFVNAFGGYQCGRGDGDPLIQVCVPNNSALMVFKNENIYIVQGFDFQPTSEYQFTVQPWVIGEGTSAPHSVAATSNGTAIIYWSGQNFKLLPYGAQQSIPIGTKLINTIAAAASGNQAVMRAACGDFIVQSSAGVTLYNDVYLCAIDGGAGIANTILMYDNAASSIFGVPMWTIFTGLNIGCFIPWHGPGDMNLLYYGDAVNPQVNLIGQNATNDSGTSIPVVISTVQDDMGTPDQIKALDRVFLELTSGNATFNIGVSAEGLYTSAQTSATIANATGGIWGTGLWGTMLWGASSGTRYQAPVAAFTTALRGRNFTYTISENSTTSAYELVGLTAHVIQEPYAA